MIQMRGPRVMNCFSSQVLFSKQLSYEKIGIWPPRERNFSFRECNKFLYEK